MLILETMDVGSLAFSTFGKALGEGVLYFHSASCSQPVGNPIADGSTLGCFLISCRMSFLMVLPGCMLFTQY